MYERGFIANMYNKFDVYKYYIYNVQNMSACDINIILASIENV